MKRLLLLITLLTCTMAETIYAQQLIPMGNSIGIKLQLQHLLVSQDVLIDDKTWVNKGTVIHSVNNKKVESVDQLKQHVNEQNTVQIELGNKKTSLTMSEKELNHLVMFLKNETEGIGTLTYLDPLTKEFGAIGHQILEMTTNTPPKFVEGFVYGVDIQHIKKSSPGLPGYKVAHFRHNAVLGKVNENVLYGVFGSWQQSINASISEPLEVMQKDEIKLGPAEILTSIDDEEVEAFAIEITDIKDDSISFELKDQTLINKTGGIIQGMSGSPIIQKDKFVGAVTHMYVEKPTTGVGLLILEMLEKR